MRRKAFTLVELLVVVGIIAILIAILIPTLGKAREQAKRVKCLSNLRQLGMAFTLYVNDYKTFPSPTADGQRAEDWVWWEPTHNPEASTVAKGSVIKYLGDHVSAEILRCPSDDISTHTQAMDATSGPYPYSYTVNWLICRQLPNTRSGDKYYDPNRPSIGLMQIRDASRKILAIDESNQTIDDGCWANSNYTNNQSSGKNCLSNRHEKVNEDSKNAGTMNQFQGDPGGGNVVFADGHAAFIPRHDAFLPTNYDPLIK